MKRGLVPELVARQQTFIDWRRQIHAHPETAFEEFKTAALVEDELRRIGLDVSTGHARTGVVATLAADQPGPSIALRADLDALNMTELNEIEHCSTHPGKMHACGHDGHTVMLLAAATHLAKHRPKSGTVHFIFQPAEENEGGGRVMIEEGVLDMFPIDEAYGMHNWPALPSGVFAVHDGPAMASADRFQITLRGRGGHGAMPHQTIDPVVASAHLIQALQTIVSRNVKPSDAAVVSVTRIQAGETFNVIPESVELLGTARSFNPAVRDLIEERLTALSEQIAAAFGLQAEVNYRRGYPPTINTSAQANVAARVAAQVVGASSVRRDLPPSMGAEDFSYFLQERPGCYVWLGSGQGPDSPGLHHPRFDFNDDVLVTGASYWVRLVEERLGGAVTA
ncbi:MAG: M20 aminoacylase family protein [Bradymonadia bacterium]